MRWIYIIGAWAIIATLAAQPWMDEKDYELSGNLSLVYYAIIALLFTIRYIGWSKWRANKIGKIFALSSVLLTVTLIQGSISVLSSSDYPWREEIRFVIYSGGAVGMFAMLVALWKEQRKDRKTECPSSELDLTELE